MMLDQQFVAAINHATERDILHRQINVGDEGLLCPLTSRISHVPSSAFCLDKASPVRTQ